MKESNDNYATKWNEIKSRWKQKQNEIKLKMHLTLHYMKVESFIHIHAWIKYGNQYT